MKNVILNLKIFTQLVKHTQLKSESSCHLYMVYNRFVKFNQLKAAIKHHKTRGAHFVCIQLFIYVFIYLINFHQPCRYAHFNDSSEEATHVITAEGLTNFLLSQEHGILKFLYVVNSFVVSPFASTVAFVLKVD